MAPDILSIFWKKPISARDFERSVFELVAKHISDKRPVAEELAGVKNLSLIPAKEYEKRYKLAAELYLLLERNIAEEQSKNRIPRETLREYILNGCHPERAEGNFALMFIPHYERQMKLFERFRDMVIAVASKQMGDEAYQDFMNAVQSDPMFKDIAQNGTLHWEVFIEHTKSEPPAVRRDAMQELLKRFFAILTGRLSKSVGELRVEILFRNVYREFHDALDFIEDVAKVLLLVPDNFLEEERIELMGKAELEKQLRNKNKALETTLAEVQGEKLKLSDLTREELEKKVQERTAELLTALETVKVDEAKIVGAKAKDDAFLENIGDGLIAIDIDWNIVLWNKAASEISGWPREEVMGKSLRNYLPFVKEHDDSPNMAFIENVLRSGKAQKVDEATMLVRKDGSKRAVATTASPILDENGKVSSVIVVFRDMTSEHELQKTREEFASLATHELRTPVAAIKGYAKLLLGGDAGPLKDQQKRYLERIDLANERLLALVNAMLNVSRAELGTLAIEPNPTYLPDIADAVIADLSPKMNEKKIRLTKSYDRLVPIIDLDSSLTHAIFQNLLSNAVKYTPDKGDITVKIEKQDPDVLITVADTGFGIPKKQQSNVFEKLFRADNVKTKEIEGSGLGLYLVKTILDQTGGTIRFASEENKGTTFFVTLPLSGMKRKEGMKGLS